MIRFLIELLVRRIWFGQSKLYFILNWPEYSFDEYFQLGSRRKVGPIKNQLASPNTSN